MGYELLLHGDRLLLLANGGYWIEPLPGMAARIAPAPPAKTVLSEVDVSDPAKLRLVRTLELDGLYVAARLVGSVVRIVAGSQIPAALPFVQPTDGSAEAIAAAERKNEAVVARSKVGNWSRPTDQARRRKAGMARPPVQCRGRRPARSPGPGC